MFTKHKVRAERLEKWISDIYWTDINLRSVVYSKDEELKMEVKEITVSDPTSGYSSATEVFTTDYPCQLNIVKVIDLINGERPQGNYEVSMTPGAAGDQ